MNTPAENIIEEPDENIKEVGAADTAEDHEEVREEGAQGYEQLLAKDLQHDGVH